MGSSRLIAALSNYAFGAMCILSALPFTGVPFPRRETAQYYRGKNQWLSNVSGGRISATTAGWLGAALRIGVGVSVILPGSREAALLVNGAIVSVGTVLAARDKRPMVPQWTMLGMVAWCWGWDRAARL